jgi:putative transposase
VENPEALASKESTVKKSRFSEAQIVGILREHEAGDATKEICRRHGISPATFYTWKAKFGGMRISDVAKMRTLEDENRRLKRIVIGAAGRLIGR